MEPFTEISYANKILTIKNGDEEKLYAKSLLDNPVWLSLSGQQDLSTWKCAINAISTTPEIQISIPLDTDKLSGKIRFGMVESKETIKFKWADQPSSNNGLKKHKFYMGFIGADDLRNGLTALSLIFIHEKAIHLSLKKIRNRYTLNIGGLAADW